MNFDPTEIPGVWITSSPIFSDERGNFRECFKFIEGSDVTGLNFLVEQTNASKSNRGVIRGMHYSLNPNGQWKWITCLSGSIFDVVLDIRPISITFKKKIEIELTSENGLGVLIQGNLAHGFQATSNDSVVVYNLSSQYNPESEFEINPHDKDLGINWPISNAIISQKDLKAPNFNEVKDMGKLPR